MSADLAIYIHRPPTDSTDEPLELPIGEPSDTDWRRAIGPYRKAGLL